MGMVTRSLTDQFEMARRRGDGGGGEGESKRHNFFEKIHFVA